MDSLLLPSSAEGKMSVLKWSRHFCGCCGSIGLREEGLKQLLCFEKIQNYGKGVITLIPVPELEQQQESSLQTGSSHAFFEIVTHRVLTWGTAHVHHLLLPGIHISLGSTSLMPVKGDVEFPLHLCEGDLQAE